jgi:hypothetical protein
MAAKKSAKKSTAKKKTVYRDSATGRFSEKRHPATIERERMPTPRGDWGGPKKKG